ncbi:MAG: acyltransferase [Ferruginibacter sp.]
MKSLLQKIFGLRKDVGLNFYWAHFFFRHILRQHTDVPWAIHYTSSVYYPKKITRGKNVYPGDSPGNFIDARNGISIGDYTNLGPNVGIVSANHDFVDNTQYNNNGQPISIGSFCWIGMGAVILPEVRLGDFTIVGAGAIVTQSFTEGYCVIAGNPAKIIKQLDKTLCESFRQSKYNS